MKLSIKKTLPFVFIAVFVLVGASFWIMNERGADEQLVANDNEIALSNEEAASLDIKVGEVQPFSLQHSFKVLGKAVYDQDARSYVVPMMTGTVEKIHARKGDTVKKGDILASIFSQEAASHKIEYQKSLNEVALLKNVMDSEETLYDKGFSSEQQFLKAKQEYDAALLNSKLCYDKLRAMGVNAADTEDALSRYYLIAPIDGTIVDNSLILGAIVDPQEDSVLVADLKRVHIEIGLNEEEMRQVHPGTFIEVGDHTGMVQAVLPAIESRTMKAYALANLADGSSITPGSVVEVKMITNLENVAMAVKKCALVENDGCNMVFVKTENGFTPQEVTLGMMDDNYVEIKGDIAVGTTIAEDNLFILKSEFSKDK